MPQAAALTLADGRRVDARWVVACDGASSTLRSLAGLTLEDLGFDEPWLVVDVLANERGLAKLPPTSVQYCEPARPCTLVIGPKNHRRWEISLNDGDDPRQAETTEGTWALLERWITPADGQLWRQASYRFHALVAQRWRAGRLFLAGDAAHQQPPFLGQGMCQGIRDVANLAWKLDAVIKREAGEALLDSYGVERGRHVRELTTRLKSIGALIGERDAARAHARDERLLAEAGGSGAAATAPGRVAAPAGRCAGARRQPCARHAVSATVAAPRRQARAHGRRRSAPAGAWCSATSRRHLTRCCPGLRTLSLPDLNEADGVLAAWFRRASTARLRWCDPTTMCSAPRPTLRPCQG